MKTNDINKTTDMIKKIQNQKSAGLDGVQGYCLTKLTALNERLAKQMDIIISSREEIRKWKSLSVTVEEMLLMIKDQYRASL